MRIAQGRFPDIHFYKTAKIVDGEIVEFDEFLDEKWISRNITMTYSWTADRPQRPLKPVLGEQPYAKMMAIA